MNSDEVKRLRELEAAATPAPWTVKTYQDESGEWNPAPSWHVWDEDNLFLTFELRNHAPALLSAVEERDRLRDQLTAKPPTCIDCGAPADVTGQCSRRCQGVNITECQVLPEPNPVPDDIARRWAQLVAERDTARTQLATERAESERLRGMVRRLYLALRRVRGWGTSAPQDVRDCAEPVWMLGHYGVQWYDPAGGVKKELARWDDEPAKLPAWRYDVTGREIRVGDWVDSELVLDGPRQVVSVSNDTWIHLSGGEVLANQRGSKLVSHLRIVDPPEQPATEDYPPPSKLDCNGREVKIGSWVVPIDCAVSDPVPYQANYVGPELRAGRLRVVDEAEMKLRAELQAAQARIAEQASEIEALEGWEDVAHERSQQLIAVQTELAESKKRCETAETLARQWRERDAITRGARDGWMARAEKAESELAALRKREADKLSAIAADIAPLNPPAPDSTVRRDGMVCTCGESERRWHLRDCPMSSAGKVQRKEGEK